MAVAPQRTTKGAPSVLAEPGAHASPGQLAVLRVHARNLTTQAQELTFSAIGLEGGWLPAPVAVPAVPADATVTVELPLMPPVGAAPGDYPFVVAVEARGPGAARATTLVDVVLRVDGVSDLVLSVEPADSRAVRRKPIQVVLANTGEQPVRVRLDALGDADLAVDLNAADVDLAAHQTIRIPGQVRALRPRLVGSTRRSPFHVVATGARAPQRFDGSVALRPLLTSTALKAVAITMVSLLWIGAVLAALPLVSQVVADRSQEQAKEPAKEPGDEPGGGGTEGGTDGGTEEEAPAVPAPAPLVPGVRVAGQVTGSEPAGVQVQVSPASAFAPEGTATPPPTAAGADRRLVALAALTSPGRAAAMALATAEPSSGAGKVLGTALPVELTDEASQRRSTTTDEKGTWAFADLSATGRYLIVLSKPGYQTQRFLVTGAEAAVAPLTLEMVPGNGRMSGTVTGPDGAAGGVEITLSDGTTTVTTRTATSGRVGYWEVDGLSTPSTYLVTASAERLGAQSVLLRLEADGARTVNLGLRSGVATLSGTVRGTDSLGGFGGLGGLTVTASAGEVTRTATTVTGDRAGTVVLPDLPVPASYTVTVSGAGYATQTRQVDVGPEGVDPLDIVMTSVGGVVEGTVTSTGGEGLAGAGLTLDGPTGTYKTMAASDGSGTFRLSGIDPGQYVLTATVFGHEPGSAQVTVTSGSTARADLVLAPIPGDGLIATSRIRGGVRDASDGGQVDCPNIRPGEECRITVTGDVTDAAGVTRSYVAYTDPDRDYTFPASTDPGLLPGLYRLTIAAPGYEDGHVNVTVAMGRVVEATPVALERSPSIIGTVQARVDAVPTGTCVIAVPTTPDVVVPAAPCTKGVTTCEITGAACSFLGLNGSYEINRLTAGAYTVFVVPPADDEYLPAAPGAVALVPGSSQRFDAVLDRLGRLNVTVMRSDGSSALVPAVGASVETDPASVLPTPTPDTDVHGLTQVIGLEPGDYQVTATGVSTGSLSSPVTVGLNQEVPVQIVLTLPVAKLTGSVVTQLVAGEQTPVRGAVVTVTGTTRFNGLTPVRESATATTPIEGAFTICTDGGACPEEATSPDSTMVLPLVQPRVDVTVTAAGFQSFSAADVPTSALATITLSPAGVPFSGTLAFVPGLDALGMDEAVRNVRFAVQSAPPGTGQLSLTAVMVGSTPTVVWSDSAQGADPTGPTGSRLIRPGTYTVTATLPGYDLEPQTFTVDPGVAMPRAPDPEALVFELRKFGFLRVTVGTTQDPALLVQGSIVTITLQDGTTQQREAHPGDTHVDFGDLPTDDYTVEVRAPGHARVTTSVRLDAGDGPDDDKLVTVRRLGLVQGVVRSVLTTGLEQDLPGAQMAVRQGVAGTPFVGTTGSTGTYRLTGNTVTDGLVGGGWQVEATAPGHDSVPATAVTVPDPLVGPLGSLDVDVPLILLPAKNGGLQVRAYDGTTVVPGLTMQLSYLDSTGPRTITPTCGPDNNTDPCPGGLYVFFNVPPLTYNLNISGPTYSPLSLPVTIPPGETPSISVPMTTPSGSIQGLVQHQRAGGRLDLVEGAVVTLTPQTGDARTTTTDANGQYAFPVVVAGTYTVSTTVDGLGATRTVAVQPGQGIVVDLVLQDVTRQVQVTVTSANGTDLTGALVSLTSATVAGPAAQPVVRTGAGASTYTTTFNQVPTGPWTVTVSGPSGHLGTHTGTVDVPATGTGAVPAAVTVRETQLALRATSSVSGAPATVLATVTQGGTATPVTVAVGGGDSVLFLPDTAATVTAAVTGGWVVTVTGGTIPAGTTFRAVTMDVAARPTTTTATVAAATVVVGGTVSVTARVQPASGSGTVSTGALQLQRRTAPNTWADVGSDVVATGADQTLTATADAGWGTGAVTLRVAYSGAGSWAASASLDLGVTVQRATTTGLTAAAGVLTATVSPAAATGTVVFEVVPATGAAVAIPTCAAVALTAGVATCTYTPAAGVTENVRARYPGATTFVASQSGNVSISGPPVTP
ncbi:carboxypeptidase regulatory-like domain-containing protein [Cellulomonas sp. P5_C5]